MAYLMNRALILRTGCIKKQRFVLYILLLLVMSPLEVLADSWPKLNNGSKLSQCSEALQVAKTAFKSDAFYLFSPPVISKNLRSILVFGPHDLEISGGIAPKVDGAIFDEIVIDRDGAPSSIYWQKIPRYGYRLVLFEQPINSWRGYTYTLGSVGEKINQAEFLSVAKESHVGTEFIPIISDSGRPPLIFLEENSVKTWIIDVGQPFQFLGEWRIHVVEPDGVKLRCTVQFRPEVTTAVSLLSRPLRSFAKLLDQTIGPGKDEGTLQQTARLRNEVEHTWANVALRPWALNEPYNTRVEVDAGLVDWARKGARFRKVYEGIQKQYLFAQQALAEYYQNSFHQSEEDAKSLAAYGLDIAFRSHFTFHSEDAGSRNPKPNPWRGQ